MERELEGKQRCLNLELMRVCLYAECEGQQCRTIFLIFPTVDIAIFEIIMAN